MNDGFLALSAASDANGTEGTPFRVPKGGWWDLRAEGMDAGDVIKLQSYVRATDTWQDCDPPNVTSVTWAGVGSIIAMLSTARVYRFKVTTGDGGPTATVAPVLASPPAGRAGNEHAYAAEGF